MACPTCKRKVGEKTEEGYPCKSCDKSYPKCNVTYNFTMCVEDGTSGIYINVIGEVGAEIMNLTAAELKKHEDEKQDIKNLYLAPKKCKVKLHSHELICIEILHESQGKEK